ncbi:adenine deaminase [Bacillus solimangrovi]|uniref:adenine deaminase n=1 Tax=Bacillus solimangrovi TaxID=1305675 RepID=A0A1E5LH41_9BACI|nr:adenine deaminase C-terminal domain-containing protein [Bacillus solimangrovi]OEH93395.1 adenosine deaminase [Bacillus solimangrovi]
MPDSNYYWRNKQLRDHINVLDGLIAPTIVLRNATYLNAALKKWMEANIWIYDDRIVYVGQQFPENSVGTEIIDCKGQYIVPGYIEPHAHPFQLYNPHTFAEYASQTGTTTLVNDNLMLILNLQKKKAFSLMDQLDKGPVSMYWWCRYDPQTEIQDEEEIFSYANMKEWLEHKSVLQGGEMTAWPKVLAGDDLMLHWMQETKRLRKPIEGHFPGASEKTLTKMKLLGADCDHEAMTGEEVLNRLLLGYTTSLRNSSIRPDLPKLLDEMHELGVDQYDRLIFTTDGSPPSFYEDGLIDEMIRIAIDRGVPEIEAYQMASYNVAKHYNIDHMHGMIGPGRIAHLNILEDPKQPKPISVLAKGKWVRRNDKPQDVFHKIDWGKYDFTPLRLDWDLSMDDMQFSMPFGVEMVNSVITKPYSITLDASVDKLSHENDESFLMLIDREGQWHITTLLKGFASNVCGLASSFSNTGDIILIGKKKADMLKAFQRMKEIGGGIVLVEDGEVICEISLTLTGIMSNKPIGKLIEEEKELSKLLRERGYHFVDPVYTLLFLSSTHLPYIRITPQGIFDVMKKSVLFPSIMR